MAAEAETGGERTEEPSQRRLQEARERGQVPRSRELTNFATMIGGSATLVAIGGIASRAPVANDAQRPDHRCAAPCAITDVDVRHRSARPASAP